MQKIAYFCTAKRKFNMLEYNTTTLPSGLRIVHRYNNQHVGYCGIMVDCGTRHEVDPRDFGLAHFIEHILFKGTTHRDAWHINQRIESVGGELNAFTTKEDTTYYATFLAKDFPRACELLCDLLCHPAAPQQELEKEQEVVVEEIESYRDNPAELIYDVFENRLYAGTALGHNILGSEETVRAFDHDRCIDFLRRNYTPQRMVFFAYGPMSWDQVVRTVEKYYDLAPAAPTVASSDAPIHYAPEPCEAESQHQSHCILGGRTYPIGHPDGAALALLNNLLGGPGMNSRLNQQLREKRGLVYTVESNLTHYTDGGYLSIYFGCDQHDTDRCIRLCRKELQRLIDTPLTARQLQAAQQQYKGQLGISTANLENNALALAKSLLRRGKIETLDEVCAHIDAVTPDQLQRVAAELFTEDRLLEVRTR